MDELLQSLPPWAQSRAVQASLVLALSLVLAKLTDVICVRVIRTATRRTRTEIDDRVIDLLHRPIFISVLLIGLGIVTQILDLPRGLGRTVTRVLQTIAIVVWTIVIGRGATILFQGLSGLSSRFAFLEDAILTLFANLAKVVAFGGAVYFVFLTWEIDVTGWLASAGIIGIAVGFAARDTIANLFGGVFILADRPYKIGDFINLDSGERGMVTQVGLRTTRLLTRDDVEITIPNSVMMQAKIINETGGPYEKTRLRLAVGVAYGSDIDQVQGVLLKIAQDHGDICDEPAPRVRFRHFGDSSLDFELLCWVHEPVLRGLVLHQLHCSVYEEFHRHKIQIPFPQRDVHLNGPGASG